MLRHIPVPPPEFLFPADDWRLIQTQYDPQFLDQTETLFSLSNGYLGIRGAFDEGRPAFQNGTFINGFYETWPIVYGESAYGFAKTGQTIVNVPDAKIIRLYVDDEPFYLPTANLLAFERVLDMKKGTLDRSIVWETASQKKIQIRSRRMVSLKEKHVAAISYEVTCLNAHAPIVITSDVVDVQDHAEDAGTDPRRFRGFRGRVLVPEDIQCNDKRFLMRFKTRCSQLSLACAVNHTITTDCLYNLHEQQSEDSVKLIMSVTAEPGKPIEIIKYITYHTSGDANAAELTDRAVWTLDRVQNEGFETLAANQEDCLQKFWERSDVQIESKYSRGQQAIRWNLFQLYQATARAEGTGIPAKGLTAQGYEGHYFWDTEIYVLPFLIYNLPHVARNVLQFRYSILDKARDRAREVNQRGALFPWRTIGGEEASSYYAAGTAQYHINADIAYAIAKYCMVTGDNRFLYEYGTEILVETARLWYDLGFFSDYHDGHFCIQGVTGPDEYTTVVNNNTFTNLMARENLRFAVESVEKLRKEDPDRFAMLAHRTKLNLEELDHWRRAAEKMFVPHDDKLKVHLQDEDFLKLQEWDIASIPLEKFPLLLHFHPLVIYRHRVIKQADLVLAMFLLSSQFTLEEKRRNFDFYDPLTTGDSSLSCCIQSIIAAEIGEPEKAMSYFAYAALMDLADVAGNVRDGCHIASIGGTWMALIYGFAGMRDDNGVLTFNPRVHGTYLQRLQFSLMVQGKLLHVDLNAKEATYSLREGDELVIYHGKNRVLLRANEPVTKKISQDTPGRKHS